MQKVGDAAGHTFQAKKIHHIVTIRNLNDILINSYEAAGQVVPHFHVHVIPRYTAKDGFRLEFKELKDVNLPKVAEEIKDNL